MFARSSPQLGRLLVSLHNRFAVGYLLHFRCNQSPLAVVYGLPALALLACDGSCKQCLSPLLVGYLGRMELNNQL